MKLIQRKYFYFNPLTIKGNDTMETVNQETKNDTSVMLSQNLSDIEGKFAEVSLHNENGNDKALDESLTLPSTKTNVLLMNNLIGCHTDMMELTLLFKSLGYNVINPISDVTHEKLKAILEEFKEMDHGESAFIIFYGDGFDNYIVTSDHYELHFNELYRHFNDKNCPNLIDRAKIFITNLSFFEEEINGDIKFESTCQTEPYILHKNENYSDLDDLDASEYNEYAQHIQGEKDMFHLTVEMDDNGEEKGLLLLTKALSYVILENKAPTPLDDIMDFVSKKFYELQDGSRDQVCELHDISFLSDFCINPIKANKPLNTSINMSKYNYTVGP